MHSAKIVELERAVEDGKGYVETLEGMGTYSYPVEDIVDDVLSVFQQHVTAGDAQQVRETCRHVRARLNIYFRNEVGSIEHVSAEDHIDGRVKTIGDLEELISERELSLKRHKE